MAEKLSEAVLKARAKKLYFDNPNNNAKVIFVTEDGRFSYSKENLQEITKHDPSMGILKIEKDQTKGADTSKIVDYSEISKAAEDAKKKEVKSDK